MVRPRAAAVALVLLTLAVCAPASSAKPAPGPRFTSGSLPVPGVERNRGSEPALAVAPDGRLWATANAFEHDCLESSLGCGAHVWTARASGQPWRYVGNPFGGSAISPDNGFGGYDSDIAVAPTPNAEGHRNVYVVSLWSLGNSLAVTRDSGATWELLPMVTHPHNYLYVAGFEAPPYVLSDRPWVGAAGACTVYVAYNSVPINLGVFQAYDACGPRLRLTTASLPFDAVGNGHYIPGTNDKVFGRFAVSPRDTKTIYFPAVGTLPGSTSRSVYAAISRDGGRTWVHRQAAKYTGGERVGQWPTTAAVDAAGRLHIAWYDDRNAYVTTSGDGGERFSRPMKLNRAGSTAVFPVVVAARAGDAAVVWYGADRPGPADSPSMGQPFAAKGADWRMTVSRSRDGGAHWSKALAPGRPVHRGLVCLDGSLCPSLASRAIYESFGAALDLQGRLSAVYSRTLPANDVTIINATADWLAM